MWLTFNYNINNCQNFDVNNLFWLKINLFNNLYWLVIIYKNAYAKFSDVLDFIYGIKYMYFVSRSVITKMLLYDAPVINSYDCGSFTIKFKIINFHALSGGGIDYNSSYSLCRAALNLLHKL